MQRVIELSGVSFDYGRGMPALTAVDLLVAAGEFVAVAGPNGGGKTTLLKLILGLEVPTAGRALLFGQPAHRSALRSRVGYLPQRAALGVSAPATVRELVEAGRAAVERPFGPLSRDGRRQAERAVDQVGLSAFIERPVATLSGGQQQRAFLAKILAGQPSLIALDEPTLGVDADAQERLGDTLAALHRELGVTILYVSHEFGAIERHAQRLILVRGGIGYDGPVAGLPPFWHDPSHAHPRGAAC